MARTCWVFRDVWRLIVRDQHNLQASLPVLVMHGPETIGLDVHAHMVVL